MKEKRKQSFSRLRIGTRGSPLALAQAREVQRRLENADPALSESGAIEIVAIKTTGDRTQDQDRALVEMGGKGLFIKEIEEALIAGAIDIAVHSMKDVPTDMPAGLIIAAMLPREDTRDVLISDKASSIAALPENAIVGTVSLRRQVQLLSHRKDLRIVPLRGNVDTRIAKVKRGDVDATILALAGLKRLGNEKAATAILSIDEMLPAAGQGAIGIEALDENESLRALLATIDDQPTTLAIMAERACLGRLEGSCRTPIAAYATIEDRNIYLRALLAEPDGSNLRRVEGRASLSEGEKLGLDVASKLKAMR